MTPVTLFLAKLIGAYSLVMAAWLVLRGEAARAFVERIANDEVAITTIGMIRLTLGLAIILGHDSWDGALAIFVSLLGWTIFLSGLFTLFAPFETVRSVFRKMRFGEGQNLFALFSFLIGGVLLIGGFTG